MDRGLHVKYPLLFPEFKEMYIYIYSKNTQTLNFMKIRLVGAQLIHEARGTEGQTDMTNIIFAFGNFAKGSENLFSPV